MANVKLVQQIPGDLQAALNASTAWRRRNKQVIEDQSGKRFSGRDFEGQRIPTIVTTQEAYSGLSDLQFGDEFGRRVDRLDYERPFIECWANPAAANWSTPRREAFQKVRSGSIRYAWRRRNRRGSATGTTSRGGTYYDEFPVGYTFQSGNIYTNPGTKEAPGQFSGEVPPGLDDFYLFLRLLNQPKLLQDGRENWHIMIHTSPIFPSITLKGWFMPEGTTWSETSEGGFGFQWNATIEVHQATPSLWAIAELQAKFAEYQREVPRRDSTA